MFSGESDNFEKAIEVIKSKIEEYKVNKISNDEFERQKKKLYGNIIKGYNDTSNLANELIACHFENKEIFDYPKVLESITLDDVNQRLEKVFKDEYSCVSIIKNSEEI